MKVLIVSGGTGGHIYPGLAVAEEFMNRGPGTQVLFIGSAEGLEKEIVPKAGYELKLIKARALLRKLSYKAVSAPFVCAMGFLQSLVLVHSYAPDVVIATGGYVSLPVVLAARFWRKPVCLLEQNVLPGAVNRLVARFASQRFLAFEEAQKYLSGKVVGNPVRRAIIEADRKRARQELAVGDRRAVLVMGGSQGAKKLNETLISVLDRLPENVFVLHIIGNRDYAWVDRLLEGKRIANYRALPYLHDMSQALAAADLVISRAGATAIAECLVRGLPMVLVPFPYAAEDHQKLNASVVVRAGAAIMIEDKNLTPEKMLELLGQSLLDYDRMKNAALALARPDAAKRIVDAVKKD
ncbi:MAG: undecaprenyldiphospho-muramoylpentapeptide beta-N-acetylglucosaminyltransferase [Candidatus Saganbacteria bacterium]|nr:undecaprenyldiphospho-muramoylpentapeptide beta-N-acetylglucosaminyltransferase [Candidatus Saganbacteria bacterium]